VERAAPEGVDIACDANGPETLAQSYRHLRATGRLLVYGFHTMLPKIGGRLNYLQALWGLWRVPRFNPLHLVSENKGVIGFNLSFLFDRQDLLGQAMRDLLSWASSSGRLRPNDREARACAGGRAANVIYPEVLRLPGENERF
jgi:NADPH:quinone reductase-like Zn-dependent oxidoreductase